MPPRPTPTIASPPVTMQASNRSPLGTFLKQFQTLMTLKDTVAQLDDPTSDPFKVALCNFLTALVRFSLSTALLVSDLALVRTRLSPLSTSCRVCPRQAGTTRLVRSLAGYLS